METKGKNRFWKGLLIYILVMLVVIAMGLAVFWKFIAAYETSRPDGIMDAYLSDGLTEDLEAGIAAFAQAHAAPWQDADAVRDSITAALAGQELTSRKATVSADAPAYTLRAGKTVIGTETLEQQETRGLFSFGFSAWAATAPAFDFSAYASTLTILAPEGAEVSVNGAALDASGAQPGGLHPDLAEFAEDLSGAGGMVTYTVADLYVPAAVTAADDAGHGYLVETGEDGTVSVSMEMPGDLETALRDYAGNFVTAYIAFTSHAVEGPGTVQSYLIPGSTLSQRMYAAQDGLSWVRGVTASMSGLTLENFRYYGSAVLCDARYTLTSGGGTTENEMRILLTETDSGWRVANLKLF